MPVSDTIAFSKISPKPWKLNVIQAYAPTSKSTANEVEVFYKPIDNTLRIQRKKKVISF